MRWASIASRSQVPPSRPCSSFQRDDTQFATPKANSHLPTSIPTPTICHRHPFRRTLHRNYWTTMGISLEKSPFLQAVSGSGSQRIQSSITELLKALENGPRYLNQLEEIVRFASGGSVTGAYRSSTHPPPGPTEKLTPSLSIRRRIVDRKPTNLLYKAPPNQPSKPHIFQSRNPHFPSY